MDIKEVEWLKKETESIILEAIRNLEEKSGMVVLYISIEHSKIQGYWDNATAYVDLRLSFRH